MLVAHATQTGQEVVVGDDVAALALDRLDEYSTDLAGRDDALEDALLELVEAGGKPLAEVIEPIVRMARTPVVAATKA